MVKPAAVKPNSFKRLLQVISDLIRSGILFFSIKAYKASIFS